MQTQDLLKVFDAASEGAFAISQTGTIIAWNAAAQRLLGYTRHQVLGQHCYEVFRQPASAYQVCRPGCAMLQAIAEGRPVGEHALVAQRADGVALHLSSSSVLVPLGDRATGAVIMFRSEGQPGSHEPVAIAEADGIPLPSLTLEVRCFGSFEVVFGSAPLMEGPLWRPRVRALFKHLVIHHEQPLSRVALIDRLWPGINEPTGRRNLKVLVHELNQAWEASLVVLGGEVQTPLSPLVLHSEGNYYLSPYLELEVDVEQFQDTWLMGRRQEERGGPEGALAAYQRARSLYRGEYLAGDLYEDWSTAPRERLQETYVSLLRSIARLAAERDWLEESIGCCREALAKDPCREDLHRDLMRYLARAGRRAEALRQYRACRAVLKRELEVEPAPETERVYEEILRGKEHAQNGGAFFPITAL